MSDSNDKQLPIATTNPVVEQILRFRFPNLLLYAAASRWPGDLGKEAKPVTSDYMAKVQVERARLLVLPPTELAKMLQGHLLSEQKKQQAQAAEKLAKKHASDAAEEAARFYNQPNSLADLDYWAKAEYWTFDEAIALLLGREPSVVTPQAIKKELSAPSGFLLLGAPKPPTAFLLKYERLRNLAIRAQVMTKTLQLRPCDVVTWAIGNQIVEIPRQFECLTISEPSSLEKSDLDPVTPQTANLTISQSPASPLTPVTIKKAALISKYERSWRTIDSDLRHANENGLARAGKSETHGQWVEVAALQWARQNGKLQEMPAAQPHLMSQLTGKTHRIAD